MAEETPKTRFGGRGRMLGIAAAVIVAIVALVFWHYSGRQSTDDAQIDGHITQISARVGGTVVKVAVTDNQFIEAGALIAQIDPRDYQVAVDRAKAELADAQAAAAAASTGVPIAQVSTSSTVQTASGALQEAQAALSGAQSQVEAARAQLVAAQARLREKEAAATKTARDVERLRALVAKDEVSQQQFDAAVASADAARASADAAKSDVASAESSIAVAEQRARQAQGAAMQAQAGVRNARTAPEQLQVTRSQAAGAAARVQQASAALAQAQLNLERATITAPSAGVVSRKQVEVGQVVQSGQPLLALVQLADVWVTANYKETQLKNVRVGQRATVEVDALGGREFRAHVDSIAGATGAKFSLLPPENATGNYVKVVQRIPVKIMLEPGQDTDRRLRPGMSVVPTIFTK